MDHHRIKMANNSFKHGLCKVTLAFAVFWHRFVKPGWPQANSVDADILVAVERMLSTASYPEPESTIDTAIPTKGFVYLTKPGEVMKKHTTPTDPPCLLNALTTEDFMDVRAPKAIGHTDIARASYGGK